MAERYWIFAAWAVGTACLLAPAGPALALDPGRSVTQYAHEVWTAKDGLPEGKVFAIRQGPGGYLWLGTQAGLVRFDGVRFTTFGEQGAAGLPPHSFVRDLEAGPDGSLWIAMVGGVARYRDGRFAFFGEQQGLRHPFSETILPEGGDNALVGTGGTGLWSLRAGTFKPHPIYRTPGLPTVVEDLVRDQQGTLWVSTDNGLLAVSDGDVRRYTTADGLAADDTHALTIDHRGTLWVATAAGLSHRVGERFVTLPWSGRRLPDVRALHEDRDGNLWAGTANSGLLRLTEGRLSILDRAQGLVDSSVFGLAEGQEGSLWVGTGRGLERLRDGVFITCGPEEGFPEQEFLNLAVRRAGGLWVTDASGNVMAFEHGRVRIVASSATLAGERMLGLAETQDGTLWIGGPTLSRVRDGRLEPVGPHGDEVTVVVADGDGLLLARTRGDGRSTLWRFAAGRFVALHPKVPFVHIQRILRDGRQRLWVSTGGAGLYRLDGEDVRVFRKADGLPDETVYSLVEDTSGALWAATRGGLVRVRGEEVFAFGPGTGPPTRAPVQLVADDLGFLWGSSDDGIFRVRTEELDAVAAGRAEQAEVRVYTMSDGLRSSEMSWHPSGAVRTPDGRLWFATTRGLSTVDPATIRRNDKIPPVYVEGMLLDGKAVPLADPVVVPPGVERLELRFTALSLADPAGVRFRYRLEGVDRDWVHGSARSALYANVAPGEHVFRVEARNADGVWNHEGARVRLIVSPLWHQRALVWVLFAVLLLGAAVGLYRLRVRGLRRTEQRLRQRVAERTQQLSAEVAERRNAEDQIRHLNEELEGRVRARTGQLESAMRALEADIERRLTAEAALRAEKERLVVTLRSIGDAVIATDVDGQVVLMNRVAESLTGWPASEAQGRPLAEVMRLAERETRAPIDDPVRSVVEAGRHIELPAQALLVARDGREVIVADSAAPIRDPESQIVGVVIVLRDVTDKQRLEEQLRNAQKLEALGILAGGLAHDFNNLLTGVFGYIDLARTARSSTDQVEHSLKNAMSVLERARGLTRQLLTFTRAGQPITRPVELEPLLKGAARFVLSGSPVSAVFAIAPGLWPCQADEQQIDQAVDNLLLNARQAMPGGGTITIGAENTIVEAASPLPLAPGRYVRLWIRDEGPGIPRDLQEKVFNPFFTTKPSGSGLGLTTTYSIVKKHEGHVDLASAPGEGTTFSLYLPAAPEGAVRPDAGEEQAVTGEGRVLVMDDEEYVRDVSSEVLELLGYGVEAVSNGDAAVASFERARAEGAPFDLVILDLTVPGGLGGLATLARLKAIEPEVRALASSGYSADAVMADPRSHGFVGGLVKPYTIADISAAVAAAMKQP